MRALLCLVVAAALAPSSLSASPQSDAAAVRKAGLVGTWSLDCHDRLMSPDNPHETFSIGSDGTVTRTIAMGVDHLSQGDSIVSNVVLNADGTLSSRWERVSDHGTTLIVLKIDGHQYRAWRSESSGQVIVEDGRFTNSHEPTPTFHKCSD